MLGILPYLLSHVYESVIHIISLSGLLYRLQITLSSKNCFYNILLVISYTIISLATVPTTEISI